MKIAPIHHNLVINFPCKVLGVGEELLSWFERAVLPNWAKKDIRKAADLIRVMKLRPTRIRGADGEIEQHFLGAWREYMAKSRMTTESQCQEGRTVMGILVRLWRWIEHRFVGYFPRIAQFLRPRVCSLDSLESCFPL